MGWGPPTLYYGQACGGEPLFCSLLAAQFGAPYRRSNSSSRCDRLASIPGSMAKLNGRKVMPNLYVVVQ